MLTSVVCLTLPSPSILPQKRQYFGEKLLNIHRVFFLYSCVWKISHYRRNTERYCHKFARYSCQILVILQFSRHIFEKCFNIKFRENPSSGSRCVPCGRKGGRTDMTKLIFAFRNFANTPKRTLSKTDTIWASIKHLLSSHYGQKHMWVTEPASIIRKMDESYSDSSIVCN